MLMINRVLGSGGSSMPLTAAARAGDDLGISVLQRQGIGGDSPVQQALQRMEAGIPRRAEAQTFGEAERLQATLQRMEIENPSVSNMPAPSRPAPSRPAPSSTNTPVQQVAQASDDQLFNFRGTDPGWFGSQWMQDGGMRGAIGGAAIGMAASYVTGGELGQGALMGAAGGALGRGIHTHLKANSASLHNAAVGYTGFGSSATQWMLKNPNSINTIQRRTAAMAGAGLMGVVGGGNRKNNHRRGLNAHRGNHF